MSFDPNGMSEHSAISDQMRHRTNLDKAAGDPKATAAENSRYREMQGNQAKGAGIGALLVGAVFAGAEVLPVIGAKLLQNPTLTNAVPQVAEEVKQAAVSGADAVQKIADKIGRASCRERV